jgi:peroxiredoxin Q/BCP
MDKAPDFHLNDQDGTPHSLSDYAGKWLVLYFYPKDGTSGCTTEACAFRDARDLIADLGKAEVVGVSKDTGKSHKKFADEHKLSFTLLSDPTHETIEDYCSWKPLKFMGHEYMGTQRNTFIISPDGLIAKKYEGVDPETHVADILEDLKTLQETQAA